MGLRHIAFAMAILLAGTGSLFESARSAPAVPPPAPPSPNTEELLPHKAGYRLRLHNADPSSGIIGADGLMEYRFDRLCNGWTVENRTFLRLYEEDGLTRDTVWTFSSWESLDGRLFRFRANFAEGGETLERLAGDARLGADDEGGVARFSKPEERTIELPPGTVFPTEHVALLVAAAERGDSSLHKIMFDGASIDNPYLVHAEIGIGDDADARRIADAAKLPPRPVWWAQIAYFPVGSASAEPEFELGVRYRDDGVAGDILQYFSDFSLSVRLIELELLPAPDC